MKYKDWESFILYINIAELKSVSLMFTSERIYFRKCLYVFSFTCKENWNSILENVANMKYTDELSRKKSPRNKKVLVTVWKQNWFRVYHLFTAFDKQFIVPVTRKTSHNPVLDKPKATMPIVGLDIKWRLVFVWYHLVWHFIDEINILHVDDVFEIVLLSETTCSELRCVCVACIREQPTNFPLPLRISNKTANWHRKVFQ